MKHFLSRRMVSTAIRLQVLLLLMFSSFDSVPVVYAERQREPENPLVSGIDLDLTYISRTPRYNWDSAKQWPAAGETVTFTAYVINKGSNASGSFSFQWLLDGQVVGSGISASIAPQAQAAFSRTWSWQTGRHTIAFRADTQNQVNETAENNNTIVDFTDALTVGFWVEQSVYNDFNSKQNGRGTYSWEDWAQYQISTYNDLLKQSQLPLAPEGVHARLRLDKIVIVPDGTLFHLNAQHAPYETATDVQWGFSVEEYLNCSWPGCYDVSWNIHHELGHYLFGRVDLYALDIQGGDVGVRDSQGNLIAGTPALPYIEWDGVYINRRSAVDIMASHHYDPRFLSDHTVYSLNRDWPMGQRTHNGWTYIYDIPADSKLRILNNSDQPIPNVQVTFYRAVTGDGSSGPYSQYFDNTPDFTGTTNAQGIVSLGAAPFGAMQNYWGLTAGVMIVKLYNPATSVTQYVGLEVTDFNLAYWRGETASYTHTIHFPSGTKRLRLSQNQLTFTTVPGDSPIPQKIDISFLGGGVEKRWRVSNPTVPWLRTVPYTNSPDDGFYSGPLTFIVDSTNLGPGTYTTQVTVTADSGVLDNSQNVSVTLVIYPVSPPNGADTTGVFRPSNGVIFLKNTNTTGFADVALNYGLAGDYPVVGDWDGDGDVTIGVYRNGTFYLRNSNTPGFANFVFAFGSPGDQPIAGDWDGDGVDTIGVYKRSTGQFLLRNSNTAGQADITFYLGNVGDVAIAGDWDGDGDDTTGVFRPSNGVIFLKNTNQSGYADVALNYGLAGDKPVVGDWDNDGDDTIGVFRNGRFLLRNFNTNGFANIVFDLGFSTDMPIAGNWDGLP